jgi:lysophospholipase L1-like esterase
MRAMRAFPVRVALGVVLCATALLAQSVSEPSATIEELERKVAAYKHLFADWAGLTRYGSEDSEIPPPAPGEKRVVFIGGDITERWGRGTVPFFPGKPYFNRGIGRQASAQMLVRFRQDVISLKPRAVVIEAGSNDIGGAMGTATRGTFADNIMSMTELARANGIRVVLASIPPVCDCYRNQTALRSQMRIADFNAWLKRYAAETGSVYLDYHSALAEGRNLKQELTHDGLLPNDAGYGLMAPLAEQAIAQALRSFQ